MLPGTTFVLLFDLLTESRHSTSNSRLAKRKVWAECGGGKGGYPRKESTQMGVKKQGKAKKSNNEGFSQELYLHQLFTTLSNPHSTGNLRGASEVLFQGAAVFISCRRKMT